jgi:hypothetical protein
MKSNLSILFIVLATLLIACPNQSGVGGGKTSGTRDSKEDSSAALVIPDSLDYADMKPVPLPKGFPQDVYLYANAKPIAGFISARGFAATLFTNDDLDTVVIAYRQRAELEQWQALKVLTLSAQAVIKYKRGSLAVTVRVNRKAGGSLITVSVQ